MGVDPNDFGAANAARWEIARLAVAAVEIELTGTPQIDASPEKAIAYMQEGEALEAAEALRTPTPAPTPIP